MFFMLWWTHGAGGRWLMTTSFYKLLVTLFGAARTEEGDSRVAYLQANGRAADNAF